MRSPQATYPGNVRPPASHSAPGGNKRDSYPLLMINGVYRFSSAMGVRSYSLGSYPKTSSKLRRRMAGRTALLRFVAMLGASRLRDARERQLFVVDHSHAANKQHRSGLVEPKIGRKSPMSNAAHITDIARSAAYLAVKRAERDTGSLWGLTTPVARSVGTTSQWLRKFI